MVKITIPQRRIKQKKIQKKGLYIYNKVNTKYMSARICNCSKVRSRDIRSAIPQALEKGKEITAGVIMELL